MIREKRFGWLWVKGNALLNFSPITLRITFLIYNILIIILATLQPGDKPFLMHPWDKGLHFIEYLILSLLAIFAFRSLLTLTGLYLGVFVYSVLLGFTTEVIQYFLPWRSFSFADFFFDALGAFAAIPIYIYYLKGSHK